MFEKVQTLLAQALDIDPAVITLDTDIKADLDADSLVVVEMLFTLEEELGVTIPDAEVPRLSRVGALVDYLEANARR